MRRRCKLPLFALVPVLLAVGLASAQESYPLMEMLAKKVIENTRPHLPDLARQKSQPPTGQQAQSEQRAVQALRNDP